MKFPRQSGVLLHPTSLPGPHGSGDLGPAAYHFVDWLQSAGQQLWQILPLGGIGPVTAKTIVRKQRSNLTIEVYGWFGAGCVQRRRNPSNGSE